MRGRGVKGDVRENIGGEDAEHSFPVVQQSCCSRAVRLCDQSRRAEDFTWQLILHSAGSSLSERA